MKQTTFLLLAILFLISSHAHADIHCVAKVALNNSYDVVLTNSTSPATLTVKTADGFQYSGAATFAIRPDTGMNEYYLPITWDQSILVQIQNGDTSELALCLSQSECYLCKAVQ